MTPRERNFDTSVVIVNYRTKELTLAAVRSALREVEVREVVVVDNASGDSSTELLRSELPKLTVKVLEAQANLGFGRAVNLAVPETSCDLLLLLNSDAVLLPGAVTALASTLLGDETVGIAAPAVYEADGVTLQPGSHGRFPGIVPWSLPRGRDAASFRTPDWVSGVAMMLRRDDFVGLGGFDDAFAMYLEDVDLCRRLRRLGKTVVRESDAGVIHLGGKSWISTAEKRDHYQESKITYFRKHGASPAQLGLLQVVRAVRVSAARVTDRLILSRPAKRPAGLGDLHQPAALPDIGAPEAKITTPSEPLGPSSLDVARGALSRRLPARYDHELREMFDRCAAPLLQPGSSVLDVGAGRTPTFPPRNRPTGCRYVGLDLSRSELEAAPSGSYDVVVASDVKELVPELVGSFDAIVSWQVLEHVKPLPVALENLRSYLRPGGQLVAHLSGTLGLFGLLSRVVPARVTPALLERMFSRPRHTTFPAYYDRCWANALIEMGRPWSSFEVIPRHEGARYFAFSRHVQAAYLAYEEWVAQTGHANLASYYLVLATR